MTGRRLSPVVGSAATAAAYNGDMETTTAQEAAFRDFVEEHRAQCLWFLAEDFVPHTPEERLLVLRLIEQHGDHAAFRSAARFRQWLSPLSSATSAAS